jgi:hypothetical protein
MGKTRFAHEIESSIPLAMRSCPATSGEAELNGLLSEAGRRSVGAKATG